MPPTFLFSLPGKIAMAALVLFMAYAGGRYQGSSIAKAEMAAKALSATVKTLRERNKVDDEINAIDRAALCAAIGLSDADYDECVRRLEEADAEASNGG
jgi:hypothetical protein